MKETNDDGAWRRTAACTCKGGNKAILLTHSPIMTGCGWDITSLSCRQSVPVSRSSALNTNLNAFVCSRYFSPSLSLTTKSTAALCILTDSCNFHTENESSSFSAASFNLWRTKYIVAFWCCAPFALQGKIIADRTLTCSDYEDEKQTISSS